MMRLRREHTWPRRVSRTLFPAVTIAVLIGAGTPVGAATPSSVALRIARYAVATATDDRPAHVVRATDVSNAAGISVVNTMSLEPLINVGEVFEYPRLVLFFDQKTFADICVSMPEAVGGAPNLVPCPHQAQGLWSGHASALGVSNRAIADAAARGRAVSGADVVAAAHIYGVTLRHEPTFRAGQGAIVEYSTLVEMGLNTKFRVNNCVQLPKTEYGIPVAVPC